MTTTAGTVDAAWSFRTIRIACENCRERTASTVIPGMVDSSDPFAPSMTESPMARTPDEVTRAGAVVGGGVTTRGRRASPDLVAVTATADAAIARTTPAAIATINDRRTRGWTSTISATVASVRSSTEPYARSCASRSGIVASEFRPQAAHPAIEMVAHGRHAAAECVSRFGLSPFVRVNEQHRGPLPLRERGQRAR